MRPCWAHKQQGPDIAIGALCFLEPVKKFPTLTCRSVDLIGCLAVSYSHMANATLPSALQRFTSVFGMGTGGSTALSPPGKIVI